MSCTCLLCLKDAFSRYPNGSFHFFLWEFTITTSVKSILTFLLELIFRQSLTLFCLSTNLIKYLAILYYIEYTIQTILHYTILSSICYLFYWFVCCDLFNHIKKVCLMKANNFPRIVHSTYTFVCMTAKYNIYPCFLRWRDQFPCSNYLNCSVASSVLETSLINWCTRTPNFKTFTKILSISTCHILIQSPLNFCHFFHHNNL